MSLVQFSRYSCSAGEDRPVLVNSDLVTGFKPATQPDTGRDGVKIKTSASGKNFVVTSDLDTVKAAFPNFVEQDGAFFHPDHVPAPKVVASVAPHGDGVLVRYEDGSQEHLDKSLADYLA